MPVSIRISTDLAAPSATVSLFSYYYDRAHLDECLQRLVHAPYIWVQTFLFYIHPHSRAPKISSEDSFRIATHNLRDIRMEVICEAQPDDDMFECVSHFSEDLSS